MGIGDKLLPAAQVWGHIRKAVEIHLDIWGFTAGLLAYYEKQGYHTLRRTFTGPSTLSTITHLTQGYKHLGREQN
jgi:hypothetical protein